MLLLRGAARGDDGSKPLGELVRDVLGGAGWSERAAGRRRGGPRALGVAAGPGRCSPTTLVAAAPEARLPELVRELDERAAAQHAPTVEGVTLASLHAAKGLEWDASSSSGCSDGLMPICMADGPAAVEEERRLLYVGVTRAREHLRLSWSGSRNPGRPQLAAPLPVPRRRGQRAGRGRPLRAEVGRTQGRRRQAGQGRQAGAVPQLRGRPGHRRRSARSAAATTARPRTTRRRSRRCAPGG